MKKQTDPELVEHFEEIPNVGPSIAQDLRDLGLNKPTELRKRNALVMYNEMTSLRGVRQDPCLLDVFMAAVDFMNGSPARPWWSYTGERKKLLKSAP